MTTQISDIFKLDNQEYRIANIKDTKLFNIQDIGLEPFSWCCTACWRGHLCKYEIKDNELILNEFLAFFGDFDNDNNIINYQGSVINGVQPIFKPNLDDNDEDNMLFFNNKYPNLNLKINFTGGILIGSDYESISWGYFIPAWCYKNVFELVFADGNILSIQDVSQEMAEFREELVYSKFSLLSFTQREETILKLLIEGLSVSEIASRLDKSITAINFYIRQLLSKSDVDDLSKLIKYSSKYYGTNQNDELLLKLEPLRKYFYH